MSKNKKILIISLIITILIIGVVILLMIFEDKSKENTSKGGNVTENQGVEDKLVAPAKDTTDLINNLTKIEVEEISNDTVMFSKDIELIEGEKVEVWLYSEPKFVGYFEVIIKDGMKKIEGLAKALENISVETGKHNLAIVTEKGKEIGYIDIYLNKDGLSENEVKEIIEKEAINFKTTKQEEVNMKNGTKEIVQKGENGEKEVTYKVTYDASGKEISREKVEEKITKEAVEQVEKVGTSDFNINKDMLMEVSFGPMCQELTTTEYSDKGCVKGMLEYVALRINTTEYITSIKENGTTIFSGLLKTTGSEGINLVATYKGTKYYFYKSGGGTLYEKLTKETCTKYGLKCGAW